MTLQEIAEICGVSPATVSLVVNNKPGVSPKTRALVQEKLAENGYMGTQKPKKNSHIIQLLKFKESGMVVDDNDGFTTTTVDQIAYSCNERSAELRISTFNRSEIETVFESINANSCTGVILLGTELTEELVSKINIISKPLVVLDNYMSNLHCDSVVMNNQEIVYDAVSYLASSFKKIGYLNSSVSISNFRDRETSFYTSLREFGLTCPENSIFSLTPTFLGAYKDMLLQLSDNPPLPEAFLAANDAIAIGAIRALQEKGYSIPEDISVIGIDDIPYASITAPALSTIHIDRTVLGMIAVDTLFRRMENPSLPTIKTQIGGELIIRDSVLKK